MLKKIIFEHSSFLLRCVPDSNGCKRFCRPVTKPLIQRTVLFVFCFCDGKGTAFLRHSKFFNHFFDERNAFCVLYHRKRVILSAKNEKDGRNSKAIHQ